MREDMTIIFAAIIAVCMIVGGAFLVAYDGEQEKKDCISSGRVYIEDHCYDIQLEHTS